MTLSSYVTVGRTGLRVSPLCLGTMTFGPSPTWGGAEEATSHQIMDTFFDAGGNFIDTANGYGGGASEEIIGSYLAANPGRRDRLVIATKFSGNLHPGDPNAGGGGRKAIIQQLEGSLRRLGTDYIDLYWQHNFDRHTPIEEVMATLDDQVRLGKVRYIGLSSNPGWAVATAATMAEFRGWAPVAALQVEYSLLRRTIEGELVPAARHFDIGVMPWSPLAMGVLTGKYTRDDLNPESGRAAFASRYVDENAFDTLDLMAEIAADHDTTVANVALAWVRQRPGVTSTLIGARTLDQLNANLTSVDVTLDDAAMARLTEQTTPILNYPAEFLNTGAVVYQQGGTTINGVTPPEV